MTTNTPGGGKAAEIHEEWKPVKGFDGLYEVSNVGRVRSTGLVQMGGKVLKQGITQSGYLKINAWMRGFRKTLRVHRLVAEAFIPNPENKPQVNHKNGIKTDNRVENLEWATSSENIIHAFLTGLQRSGETSPKSKLTEEQVKEIRASSLSQKNLGRIYNVSQPTVCLIKTNRSWKYLK